MSNSFVSASLFALYLGISFGAAAVDHSAEARKTKAHSPTSAGIKSQEALSNRQILKKYWSAHTKFRVTDVKGDQSGNFCGYRNGEIVQMGVDEKGALVVNVADPEKLFTSVGGVSIYMESIDQNEGVDTLYDKRFKTSVTPTRITHEAANKNFNIIRKFGSSFVLDRREDGSILVKVDRKNAQGGGTFKSTCVLVPVP